MPVLWGKDVIFAAQWKKISTYAVPQTRLPSASSRMPCVRSSSGDFSGQLKVVENLKVFVEAAKYRGEPLDHTLLHGPPGLGKTTLSNIIANELGVGFKVTSGPVLDKPGDLAGILTSLEPNDVLFIDEIHRLSPVVEEYLYSAMEDYRIDIMIDKGPSARSIQLDLNPFTLVGATTRSGLLTALPPCPFRYQPASGVL